MPTTPVNALRYPGATDSPNGPLQLANLASDVDTRLLPRFANAAARDAAITSPVTGMECVVAGTHQIYEGAWYGSPTTAITYTSPFAANSVTPLSATRNVHRQVTLSGLMTNAATIGSVVGTWLTLPAGYRPVSQVHWIAYIEGGAVASYQLGTDGVLSGVALVVGTGSVPSPRFWSFSHTFTAA